MYWLFFVLNFRGCATPCNPLDFRHFLDIFRHFLDIARDLCIENQSVTNYFHF